MASPVSTGSIDVSGASAHVIARAMSDSFGPISLIDEDSALKAAIPEVVACSEEFVAHPGVAMKLQKVLPRAIHKAHAGSDVFRGCLVLVSVQESRLVTVITLWAGEVGSEQYCRNSTVVRNLLEPYVDRWLRSGKFIALLTLPQL